MSFEDSQQAERVIHATLVFEREIPATAEKVFATFANAKLRAEWSTPSATATIIIDQEELTAISMNTHYPPYGVEPESV